MRPEDRPDAASDESERAPARSGGRGRLATVRADFFLDPADRLSEQERALMTAMLHCLVVDIADNIRAALPDRRVPSGDAADHRLVERLTAAGLVDRDALIAMLLRRADEERIALAAAARAGRTAARMLQGLVGHGDGAVSGAAMALILARGRRRDRYGQCLLGFDDLDPVIAADLVHHVAAAMRTDSALETADLVDAAGRVIGDHEPMRSIGALTRSLVDRLEEAGSLGDDLLLAAANEGEIPFLAEALASRAGLAGLVALDELLSGDQRAVIYMLRLGAIPRSVAAGILAAIGDLLAVRDPLSAMQLFDSLSDAQAAARLRLLTSPPAYRLALDHLGGSRD